MESNKNQLNESQYKYLKSTQTFSAIIAISGSKNLFRCDSISRYGVWEWVSESVITKPFSVHNHCMMLLYLQPTTANLAVCYVT